MRLPEPLAKIGTLERRLKENPQPFRFLWRFPRANKTERKALLAELRAWLMEKQLGVDADLAEPDAKGFARAILSEPRIQEDLGATPHMGSLVSLGLVRVSRLEYANFVCASLLQLKRRYPGLGLGSSTWDIQWQGKALSGLEIAQTVAVILNWGHLFGTFATYAIHEPHL